MSESRPTSSRHRPALSRRKRIAFAAIMLFGVACFALLLGEVLVRLVAPQPLAGVMFAEDRDFGFWLLPNLREKAFQSEPRRPSYRVTTNSDGYRMTREIATSVAEGTRRVLVLGDSFTFGVGVDNPDTWPSQLERLLNNSSGATPFEVINASCPGWGTENELAFWRKRGKALKPDVVIVAFYRNDLWDNARQLVYTHDGDRLVHSPQQPFGLAKRITRLIPFYRFLSEHSHLVNLARRLVVSRTVGPEAAKEKVEESSPVAQKNEPVPTPVPSSNVNEGILRATLSFYERLMDALIREVRASGAAMVVVVLPGEDDCMSNPLPYYTEVEKLAEKWRSEGRAHVVQMRPRLLEARRMGELNYQPDDGHLTVRGNQLVAEEVARVLSGEGGE